MSGMWRSAVQLAAEQKTVLIVVIVLGNLLFNVAANASFKVSAESASWRSFLFWQVLGNIAGLVTVLTLTGLLRFIPLHVAFPLTTGLAIIGVQVAASKWLFGETISPQRWLGTLFVVLGIVLLGRW